VSLVIDASVALKWFLTNEADADIALAIVRDGELLMAPDIVIAEVCNAAWKSARLGISFLRRRNICLRQAVAIYSSETGTGQSVSGSQTPRPIPAVRRSISM
jgi:predicted nucleic acid-binding protein